MAGDVVSGGRATAGTPPTREMVSAWVSIGMQSFGGGSATLYLMRRETVERRHWISDEEFTRYWGICQIAPGINLIGQTILIGYRIGGVRGLVIGLAGMLLPSVTLTVLITALYAHLRDQPLVNAALRGIVPATTGLGLLLSLQMVRQPLAASRAESRASLVFSLALLGGSALLVGFVGAPVLAVLWGVGIVSGLAHWLRNARGGR